ncbi:MULTISPECIES: chlorite dismutase family protein [unclassified Paenibacillus]|uniref:chlorite dismutase family protein n=1 Tax=unclassified Paenibacillus TaxID=185978 RepID=UPI0027B95693|nr:chlorite dismutase family protein [Paenibacillus sp. E222]
MRRVLASLVADNGQSSHVFMLFKYLFRRLQDQRIVVMAVESRMEGSLAMYAIVGQKADIMFINLRDTLKELNSAENAFNRSRFAKFVKPDC